MKLRKRKYAAAAAAAALTGAAINRLGRKFAAPRYHGAASDHFNGHTFVNRESTVHRFSAFLRWVMTRQRGDWAPWRHNDHHEKPPQRIERGKVRVTFVNHSTTLLQIGAWNVLTDPVWSERVSPVSFAGPRRHCPPGVTLADLPPIDAIVISHNHYDHLDIATLRLLRGRHHCPIYVPLGNSALFAKEGIDGAHDFDWWDSLEITPEIRLTSVPAQHFSGRGIGDRDATLWCGWVISTPEGSTYFAGDTGYGSHIDEIAKRFSDIRLALLPIGAYLPIWFMSPVHMSPLQAVRAHKRLRAKRSMAIHFGTFALGDDGEFQPLEDLVRARDEEGVSPTDFFALREGEGRDID